MDEVTRQIKVADVFKCLRRSQLVEESEELDFHVLSLRGTLSYLLSKDAIWKEYFDIPKEMFLRLRDSMRFLSVY